MKKSIIITNIIFCLLVFTMVTETHADITYTYTGNELTSDWSPYDKIPGITGWFTISNDPATAQNVVPTDFMFTANGHIFSPQPTHEGHANFYIVPTGGALEEWNIDIWDLTTTISQTLYSGRVPDAGGLDRVTWGMLGMGMDGESFTTGNTGVWTRTSSSPVPIPPSVWLLGSGLIGLAGLRRKFFRM